MFKKILFPVDLEHIELAKKHCHKVKKIADSFGAKIEVSTVIPGFGMPIVASYFPADAEDQARKEMKRQLEQFVSENFSDDVVTHLSEGKHWRNIIKTATQVKADLIVIPHRSMHRSEEIFLGSCAQKVAEHAKCSVMILR